MRHGFAKAIITHAAYEISASICDHFEYCLRGRGGIWDIKVLIPNFILTVDSEPNPVPVFVPQSSAENKHRSQEYEARTLTEKRQCARGLAARKPVAVCEETVDYVPSDYLVVSAKHNR